MSLNGFVFKQYTENFNTSGASTDPETFSTQGVNAGTKGEQIAYIKGVVSGTASMKQLPLEKGDLSYPFFIRPIWWRVDSSFIISAINLCLYNPTANSYDTANLTQYKKTHATSHTIEFTDLDTATHVDWAGNTSSIPTCNNSTGDPSTSLTMNLGTSSTGGASTPVIGGLAGFQLSVGAAHPAGSLGVQHFYIQWDETV